MPSAKSSRPRIVLSNRAVVLNNEGQILLIQRASNDSKNGDLWEVPGGKLDPGQDIATALEREVLEETGLNENDIYCSCNYRLSRYVPSAT